MTANQAIKKYCKNFCCNNSEPKTHCVSKSCPLYSVSVLKDPKKSKLKLIRERCLNCVGTNSSKDVAECKCESCLLFKMRSGKSPNITEETRQKAREKLINDPERMEKFKLAREKREKIKKIKEILYAS